MGDCGQIRNISEVGLLYRYSNNSITATKSRELKKIYSYTIEQRLVKNLSYLDFEESWQARSNASKFFAEIEEA